MEDEVIFEVTKDHLETGMRGYPVGYCTTSSVDPEKGLFYIGMPIAELAYKDPVEVIYLLYNGEMGNEDAIASFKSDLEKRAICHPDVVKHIQSLPREGHPMDLFSAALMILGMYEKTDDYREDSLNLIAKLPHLVATVINYHANWGHTPNSKPEMGYMENFTQMLQAPNVDREILKKVFRLFNVTHFDHGGGNLSAFTGKAVASGLQHLYGSISAAMNALAGPRHGKANQDCLEFVQMVLTEVGEDATAADIEKLIRNRLENNELIFGFGHAVLRVEDPRATIFYNFAQEHFSEHPLVKIALLLRSEGAKILAENPKIADPHPNIDAITGTVLTAAGFSFPEYYTILFGLSRSVGISRQIVYERLEARNGKGTPIIRPKYFYKGR